MEVGDQLAPKAPSGRIYPGAMEQWERLAACVVMLALAIAAWLPQSQLAAREHAEAGDKRWWEKGKDLIPSLPDVQKPVKDVIAKLQKSVRSIVDLMVVFLLQTIVLPLLFLWLFVALFREVGLRRSHTIVVEGSEREH